MAKNTMNIIPIFLIPIYITGDKKMSIIKSLKNHNGKAIGAETI